MDLAYGATVNVIVSQNAQTLSIQLIKNATISIHFVLLMEIIVYPSLLVLELLKLLVMLASNLYSPFNVFGLQHPLNYPLYSNVSNSLSVLRSII